MGVAHQHPADQLKSDRWLPTPDCWRTEVLRLVTHRARLKGALDVYYGWHGAEFAVPPAPNLSTWQDSLSFTWRFRLPFKTYRSILSLWNEYGTALRPVSSCRSRMLSPENPAAQDLPKQKLLLVESERNNASVMPSTSTASHRQDPKISAFKVKLARKQPAMSL